MITRRVVPTAVSDHDQAVRLARVTHSQRRGQERRDPHLAPGSRSTAPPGDPAPPHLAGPGHPVRLGPTAAPPAADPSDRHAGYAAGLASSADRQTLELPPPVRPPTDYRRNPGLGTTPGTGQPLLGLPQDPRENSSDSATASVPAPSGGSWPPLGLARHHGVAIPGDAVPARAGHRAAGH
jgi:hypothetical protein